MTTDTPRTVSDFEAERRRRLVVSNPKRGEAPCTAAVHRRPRAAVEAELAALTRSVDRSRVETVVTDTITVAGVLIVSRYGLAAEIDLMVRVVQVLPDDVRAELVRIFCDSKAEATYDLDFAPGLIPADLAVAGRWITHRFRQQGGGLNSGSTTSGQLFAGLDPSWVFDDEWIASGESA